MSEPLGEQAFTNTVSASIPSSNDHTRKESRASVKLVKTSSREVKYVINPFYLSDSYLNTSKTLSHFG